VKEVDGRLHEIFFREICFEDDKFISVDEELVQWLDFCNGSMKFRFIKQDVYV
jgi:hypothetical protein